MTIHASVLHLSTRRIGISRRIGIRRAEYSNSHVIAVDVLKYRDFQGLRLPRKGPIQAVHRECEVPEARYWQPTYGDKTVPGIGHESERSLGRRTGLHVPSLPDDDVGRQVRRATMGTSRYRDPT